MVRFVAITGGSGSGKTWVARCLKQMLGKSAAILELDDFYRDLSGLTILERDRTNFDNPKAIDRELFVKCLQRIQAGEEVLLPCYDFETHTRKPHGRLWRPHPIVILDGLWVLRWAEVRRLCSVTIYVDCSEELRLERRIARDQRERGRSVASIVRQFKTQVAPMHRRYVAPQIKVADVVLKQAAGREMLSCLIDRILKSAVGKPEEWSSRKGGNLIE